MNNENFLNKNENGRMILFLKLTYGEDFNFKLLNKLYNVKPSSAILKKGINYYLSVYPEFKGSKLYNPTIDELLDYYLNNNEENEISRENILYLINHFENNEQYEKCVALQNIILNWIK